MTAKQASEISTGAKAAKECTHLLAAIKGRAEQGEVFAEFTKLSPQQVVGLKYLGYGVLDISNGNRVTW